MATVVSLTPLPVQVDSRTFKQAASFARLGHRSVVVEGSRSSLDRSGLPFELRSPEAAESLEPLLLSRLLAYAGRPGQIAANVVDVLSEWRRRSLTEALRLAPAADLYWLHAFTQAVAADRLSRRYGASFVYDVHDLYFEFDYELPEEKVAGAFYRRLEAFAARRATALVTVSPGLADRYAEHFGRRPTIIRNASDVRLERPVKEDLRTRLGLDDDAFVVLVVGNEKPGMAMPALAEAIERLPDSVHLAIVGAGYNTYRNRSPRIHLHPPVPPDQVSGLIARADLGVCVFRPDTENLRYALPNRLFHIIAAGIPLIYNDLEDVRGLCEANAVGQRIGSLDADMFEATIGDLLADPAKVERLREASVRARGVVNWETEERVLASIIDAALDGG